MKSWPTEGKLIEIHILGHLTPPAGLGLESCPYYSSLVPEWYQQSPSGWMWVCDPLLFRVHLQWSSFLVLAPSLPGWEKCKFALWGREFRIAIPVPGVWHINGCRDAMGGSPRLGGNLGCAKHPAWNQEGYFTVGFPVTLHSPAREGTLLLVHLCFHRPLIKPRWICVVRIK